MWVFLVVFTKAKNLGLLNWGKRVILILPWVGLYSVLEYEIKLNRWTLLNWTVFHHSCTERVNAIHEATAQYNAFLSAWYQFLTGSLIGCGWTVLMIFACFTLDPIVRASGDWEWALRLMYAVLILGAVIEAGLLFGTLFKAYYWSKFWFELLALIDATVSDPNTDDADIDTIATIFRLDK